MTDTSLPAASRIAVELVPRSRSALNAELEAVRALGGVQTVNIPDLLRYSMRSWQGCAVAREHFAHPIPHIRAIDIDPRRPLPMADAIDAAGLTEVLVIEGDPPADMGHRTYPVTSLEIIRKFRREMPHVTVWAGLDPYRQSFARERDYAEAKLEAGAVGLFTQPFFDVRMLEVWSELLPDAQVFWGATSVTSESSLSYWQNRNKAVFPKGFQPTLDWNRQFARELLAFARATGSHAYFMPVRVSVESYLSGVLTGE
ncbi:methylenetetrahydrofolate reductase [Deinococcus aquiradiocola]|uniref:Methylenetetrahydrofolate reductase n=1 Tax=Deinococcus aquiradiocola TaxID=393059 RepID=A0A917P601_9DEIO|nr:methylenetetrahydrofolate reductase [Deinococcus aquiradiocola]GGJ63476.1 methylenetetrahydrofolate reductase [Deinococcus aquiradiocola]